MQNDATLSTLKMNADLVALLTEFDTFSFLRCAIEISRFYILMVTCKIRNIIEVNKNVVNDHKYGILFTNKTSDTTKHFWNTKIFSNDSSVGVLSYKLLLH